MERHELPRTPRSIEELNIPVGVVHDLAMRRSLYEGRTSTVRLSEGLGISMAIVWNNLRVMLAWGAIVLVLFLASVATLGLGLIVVFPVLGHGTWHAYRALRGTDRLGRESERMFIRPA